MSASHAGRACPCCESLETRLHASPNTSRSMLSSGEVVKKPLQRCSCTACGYGFHAQQLTAGEVDGFYTADYTVQRVNETTSSTRAEAVLDLILSTWGPRPDPTATLEIGCGAGMLLLKMSEHWPQASVQGVEPAPRLAALAREQGQEVHSSGLMDFDTPNRFQLICSVNVMEHFVNPSEALAKVASLLAPGGLYVQVTPDGNQPGLELLFFDHISSFSSSSLQRLADRSGLSLLQTRPLAGALQEFRLSVFSDSRPAVSEIELASADPSQLAPARERFFSRVRTSAAACSSPFLIFGAGETADLLHAYRPELVAAAEAFVVDRTQPRDLHGKPVRQLSDLTESTRFLVAVHSRSQDFVMSKLSSMGHDPIALDWGPESL